MQGKKHNKIDCCVTSYFFVLIMEDSSCYTNKIRKLKQSSKNRECCFAETLMHSVEVYLFVIKKKWFPCFRSQRLTQILASFYFIIKSLLQALSLFFFLKSIQQDWLEYHPLTTYTNKKKTKKNRTPSIKCRQQKISHESRFLLMCWTVHCNVRWTCGSFTISRNLAVDEGTQFGAHVTS